MSALHQQVMEILQQAIQQTPYITEINLQFKQIHDLQPYLQYFKQLRNLKKLSLYGNRLQKLPKTMHQLSTVQELDLAHNLLQKFKVKQNIESLKSMQNLKKLIYPVNKDQEILIVQGVKTLQYFNNNKIKRKQPKKSFVFKFISREDLQSFQQYLDSEFKKVLMFQNKYLDDSDPTALQKFHEQNTIVINDALKRVSSCEEEVTMSLQKIIDIITRYQLYDNLKHRANNLCMDIYDDVGKFYKDLTQLQDKMFQDLAQQSLKLTKIQLEYLQHSKQKNQKKDQTFEDKILKKNVKLDQQNKRLKKQKDQYLAEINHLQSQNKQYLDLLFKYSKGQKNVLNGFNQASNHNSKNNQTIISTNAIRPLEKTKLNHSAINVPSHNITHNFPQTLPNYSSSSRLLTVKQLKETIQEIYESKLKFDQKNFDGKIPRETMHQYLFTYLNQKYGLKSLTIEAANSIVTGIQAYSSQDNDVAVFGKIMKNQVDQQFRNVQSQLKSTINNLLKMHLKNQLPYKRASQVQQLYKQKINNEITSQQAMDIARYLYNKSDSDRLIRKIQQIFMINTPKQVQPSRRFHHKQDHQQNKTKRKIKFQLFLKTILDFQLKNHELLLKPLVKVFKRIDRDHDGIVNQDQFIQITKQLCEQHEQIIGELLIIVDPYETKAITFTQIVRLFANYPQNNPILSRFIQNNRQYEQEYQIMQ